MSASPGEPIGQPFVQVWVVQVYIVRTVRDYDTDRRGLGILRRTTLKARRLAWKDVLSVEIALADFVFDIFQS